MQVAIDRKIAFQTDPGKYMRFYLKWMHTYIHNLKEKCLGVAQVGAICLTVQGLEFKSQYLKKKNIGAYLPILYTLKFI
jgi:hypothetical protein